MVAKITVAAPTTNRAQPMACRGWSQKSETRNTPTIPISIPSTLTRSACTFLFPILTALLLFPSPAFPSSFVQKASGVCAAVAPPGHNYTTQNDEREYDEKAPKGQ
ncbi:MAG: hypothetical protein A3J68_02240 [Candidatus Wildermuthbacteria bacterium RIFCSPHIGHO2_02_FULL_48_16]|uniref:Uncharacterized protein n=1 Tax=Candidatus Wildermuthbacteria bacterium RIFCSPHIGHO2_02_FULL_48_16 TaxID=1802453 RepID=A0A1G2R952_9BACT|nr:MAG: hypothetical protein A3J68_02240 [Candidatus Wildermuthbacteria bacterium RIFCSPHIGHO2_02_FULL_48_16]